MYSSVQSKSVLFGVDVDVGDEVVGPADHPGGGVVPCGGAHGGTSLYTVISAECSRRHLVLGALLTKQQWPEALLPFPMARGVLGDLQQGHRLAHL